MVKKGGNNFGSYLCKRTNIKITDIAYLRLSRVRTDQCNNIKLGFTLTPTSKGVIKSGNTIDMYLCKKSNAKTSVISYLRCEYHNNDIAHLFNCSS